MISPYHFLYFNIIMTNQLIFYTSHMSLSSNILYSDILLIIEDFLIYKSSIPLKWYLILYDDRFIFISDNYRINFEQYNNIKCICSFDIRLHNLTIKYQTLETYLKYTFINVQQILYNAHSNNIINIYESMKSIFIFLFQNINMNFTNVEICNLNFKFYRTCEKCKYNFNYYEKKMNIFSNHTFIFDSNNTDLSIILNIYSNNYKCSGANCNNLLCSECFNDKFIKS